MSEHRSHSGPRTAGWGNPPIAVQAHEGKFLHVLPPRTVLCPDGDLGSGLRWPGVNPRAVTSCLLVPLEGGDGDRLDVAIRRDDLSKVRSQAGHRGSAQRQLQMTDLISISWVEDLISTASDVAQLGLRCKKCTFRLFPVGFLFLYICK